MTQNEKWKVEQWDHMQKMTFEAYHEALSRYPNDVGGALVFFIHATGMCRVEPTQEDIKFALTVQKKVELNK